MDDQRRPTVSNRWHEPTQEADGRWKATVRAPLTSRERAVGTDAVAYGPSYALCVLETRRIDRAREELLP